MNAAILAIERKLSTARLSKSICTPNSCSSCTSKSMNISESSKPAAIKSSSGEVTIRFILLAKSWVNCCDKGISESIVRPYYHSMISARVVDKVGTPHLPSGLTRRRHDKWFSTVPDHGNEPSSSRLHYQSGNVYWSVPACAWDR